MKFGIRNDWQSLISDMTSHFQDTHQWRTQAFRTGEVEVPQAPRGMRRGEGYPPPHWGKGLGREHVLSQNFFFVFFC